jgi:hypothetical protein
MPSRHTGQAIRQRVLACVTAASKICTLGVTKDGTAPLIESDQTSSGPRGRGDADRRIGQAFTETQ